MKKNGSENDLAPLISAFEKLSEESKQRLASLYFDGINRSFFHYVPADSLIATLYYWLDDTKEIIDKYCCGTIYHAPYVSPKIQFENWADILRPLGKIDRIYLVNQRPDSDKTLPALLSDLFSFPKLELSLEAKKASNLIRLLVFSVIRHYFLPIESHRNDYGSIDRRVEAMRTLIDRAENSSFDAARLLNAGDINAALKYLSSFLKPSIDKAFLNDSLREIFFDGMKAPEHSLPQANDKIDDTELNETNTHHVDQKLTALPLGTNFLSKLSISALKNETPKSYNKLRALCTPESLTSRETLKPNFLDHQRRPEYALNLPTIKYALFIEEKRELVSILLTHLADEELSRFALIVSLEMLTASPLERLTSFTISNQDNPDSVNIICLKTGMWKRQSIEFEKSFSPGPKHSFWLNQHNNFLWLPLPDVVISALKTVLNSLNIGDEEMSSGVALFRLLGLDEPKLPLLLNNYLNTLKKSLNYGFRQLTQKSIRYSLFSEVVHSVDASMASLLFATTEFSNPATLFYLSVPENILQSHYCDVLHKIGFDVRDDYLSRDIFVGSRMCINIAQLTARITYKNRQLQFGLEQSSQSIDDVIHNHNEFACMVTLGFAFNGALRSQSTHFFDSGSIDEKHNLLFVSDKYHLGENPTRLVPLSTHLASLVTQYRLQLRFTSYALKESFPALAELLYSLYQPVNVLSNANNHNCTGQPFLGLIVDGQWQPISSQAMCRFLGEDFTFPGNFTRHITCSYLPLSIAQYRQHIMGHNTLGHHVLDEMALTTEGLTSPDIIRELDTMLENLGICSVKANSLRGAFALERLSPKSLYYPAGYVERERRSNRELDFAKTYFLPLLEESMSADEIERQVEFLPRPSSVSGADASMDERVTRYYNDWKHAYIKTNSKSFVKRLMLPKQSGCTSSLRLIEYSKCVEQIQRHFLNYICLNKARFLPIESFFFSLALYQPRLAMQLLMQGSKPEFRVKKYQSTLLLVADKKSTIRVSAPLNWLSSYFLMPIEKDEVYKLDIKSASVKLKNWLKIASDEIRHNAPKLTSFKTLCVFISEYGVFTQSRISVSASKNSFLPGDYPAEDIARLLKHGQHNLFKNDMSFSPKPSVNLRLRRFLKCNTQSGLTTPQLNDIANESRFIDDLLRAINDLNNIADETSVERIIKNRWAQLANTSNNDLAHLLEISYPCSEFLLLVLFYGVMVSRRPSSTNPNQKVSGLTVHKYLKTILGHLQDRIGYESFLLYDEESYKALYSEAIKQSGNKDKKQVYDRFKDFHSEIDRHFTLDQPDWSDVEITFNPKIRKQEGNARLLCVADYEGAKIYLKSKMLSDGCKTQLAQLEYDMHMTVLALGYRAGLRKREIRSLLVQHINIDLRVLTITSTHYYGTKSPNSPRRIDLNTLFDEDEWGCLLRIIQHAKKMGVNLSSPALFGAGSLKTRLLKIEAMIINCMELCRTLSGNPSLLFYDLRQSHINYSILILAKAYEDARYETSLAQWARVRSDALPQYRQAMVKRLVGEQAEIGGILIHGLANQMGHSYLTERQEYVHVLNILDEIGVNRLIGGQIRGSQLFEGLKNDLESFQGGFRPEKEVRKAVRLIKANKIILEATGSPLNFQELLPVFGKRFEFESRFMSLCHCLSACWAVRENAELQQTILNESSLPSRVFEALYEHIDNTGYKTIYLPPIGNNINLEFVASRVDTALRYISAEIFKSLYLQVASLYDKSQNTLETLLKYYVSHQFDDDILVTQEEIPCLQSLLGVFSDLRLEFVESSSPYKTRGRNKKYYKLYARDKGATRKSSNEKLSFLMALSLAVYEGFNE